MKYFRDCKTAEDLKKAYRKAAVKLHPDNGGNEEEFKSMQAEYEAAWERLKDVHTNSQGETYTSKESTTETAFDFMEAINKVIHLDNITIEIIGSWVWITGNTLKHKDVIKAAGYFWSKSKKAWYWNGSTKKSRRRGHYSMNGLRNAWGSTVVTGKAAREEREKLTA